MNASTCMNVSARWIRGITVAALLTGITGVFAQSTTYKAPNGMFDVTVPAGWTTEWDKELNQVTLRRGSTQAIVLAIAMPKETGSYAKTFLGMTRDEFAGQCKGSDELEHGPARLAGLPANSFLVRCPNAPASVAGTTTTWSESAPAKVLLSYTVIAPIRTYGDDVAVLDAIGASIHLAGAPVMPAAEPTDELRVAEVKRACKAGSFTQEECARRMGQAMSGAADTPVGARFENEDGTFSVEVPAGWQALHKEKNGIKGVQLRSGTNWMNLMPAPEGATTASEVVLQFETKMAGENGPKVPLGSLGIIQLFGHGVEVAYDDFPSRTVDKLPVETMVAGIGDISGKGPRVLMFTSIVKGEDAASLAVAQSVRLGK